FTQNKATGQFYDPAKLHTLNHKGSHFQVRGPLSVKPTPQGRPILVQAGANAMGQEIAAADADVVYASNNDFAAAKEYYGAVKGRMAQYGREPDELKIMPALVPIVGRTAAEAQAKLEQLQSLIDPLAGLARIYGLMGDLSGYDLDGPVPEPVNAKMRSMAYSWWERAKRDGLSIRQMYSQYAIGEGFRLIGTPTEIADTMEQWLDDGAADGFNITPTHLPGGMEDFAQLVVPELRRRGRFRSEYEGMTLRENLGLAPPRSRWQS
ncbi:MAG: NtaA/DmoA family FMN-dependent monooxygenase, partial [Janthinobacterium lividum]